VIAPLMATPAVGRPLTREEMAVYPIRKVVVMLQNMQKKIEVEGAKQSETFEKYMCWCETSAADLTASIDAATTKIPQVQSDIEETTSRLASLKQGLVDDKQSREDAKAAMANATEQLTKEYEIFSKESGDDKTNLAAMKKAIAATSKGTGGAFLQTESASVLNDDDTLELFKKFVGSSFIQELVTYDQMQHNALVLPQRALRHTHMAPIRVPLELITLALMDKKVTSSQCSRRLASSSEC
jgi:hypothetical protein